MDEFICVMKALSDTNRVQRLIVYPFLTETKIL